MAFLSRKLAPNQRRWTPREQETYAILMALLKWKDYIGVQPVVVTTDHKAIESWTKEVLDTPSGPLGRRARWHEIFSRFDLSVIYLPGKDNVVADALSRWAYPASQAYKDVSKHGSAEDQDIVKELIALEKAEEREILRGLKIQPVTKKRGGEPAVTPSPPTFSFKRPPPHVGPPNQANAPGFGTPGASPPEGQGTGTVSPASSEENASSSRVDPPGPHPREEEGGGPT